MNEREKRDFNAGLGEEVDAWLQGDTSRRSFLTKLLLMGGAAALPGFGMTALNSPAWAEAVDLSKLDLADPSTPLGKPQAEALTASTEKLRGDLDSICKASECQHRVPLRRKPD